MNGFDRFSIFNALLQNDYFLYNASEESIIRSEFNKEVWLNLSSIDKQNRRVQFLESGKKTNSIINLIYYEKMIFVYSLIIDLLNYFEKVYQEQKYSNILNDLDVLRFVALLLVEQRFIDEQINPNYHVLPIFFEKIIENKPTFVQNNEISVFLNQYIDMFESWPEKSKYKPLFLRK